MKTIEKFAAVFVAFAVTGCSSEGGFGGGELFFGGLVGVEIAPSAGSNSDYIPVGYLDFGGPMEFAEAEAALAEQIQVLAPTSAENVPTSGLAIYDGTISLQADGDTYLGSARMEADYLRGSLIGSMQEFYRNGSEPMSGALQIRRAEMLRQTSVEVAGEVDGFLSHRDGSILVDAMFVGGFVGANAAFMDLDVSGSATVFDSSFNRNVVPLTGEILLATD